jgi:hypothetical protein
VEYFFPRLLLCSFAENNLQTLTSNEENIRKKAFRVPAALAFAAISLTTLGSCDLETQDPIGIEAPSPTPSQSISPQSLATLVSSLPLTLEQVQEVHSAVTSSIDNGYDEEYTFRSLVTTPGFGTGDDALSTRSKSVVSEYSGTTPMRSLLENASAAMSPSTRSASFMQELSASGYQIYWPYSENWDGTTLPTVSFDPGSGAERNVGFLREQLTSGEWIVREVTVDEEYSKTHPVWIVNANEDEGHLTPQMAEKLGLQPVQNETRAVSNFRTLRIKEFKAHRNYDSFFAGGSEFFVKIGAISAFSADILSDLTKYTPEITDMYITVKRSQVGKFLRFNTVLVSEWSDQLLESAFLMIEDDGGKRTSWKCSGTVMIKSKSYGFTVEFPLNKNDDIVWRGKLSSNYFEKYNGVANRLGDVSVNFTLN